MKIVECVPNFSEGRDEEKVRSIAEAIRSVQGIKLLDFSMDCDHHRSVFTFIGSPECVFVGAMAACEQALDVIDMRAHGGVHPRIGAVDVVPFIPLKGSDMQDAVTLAHRFGHEFAKRNQVPVYFYGAAALHPGRQKLPEIRKGGYEKLREKIKDPLWRPDAGPSAMDDRSGATVVGARMPLIAFNVNLHSDDLDLARRIARVVRESSGGLKNVQAIGVPLRSRNIVQVSMNLTNYKQTSIRTVYDAIHDEALQSGVSILESELIGLIPEEALEGVSVSDLQLSRFSADRIIETHL